MLNVSMISNRQFYLNVINTIFVYKENAAVYITVQNSIFLILYFQNTFLKDYSLIH
jgi:hypothetical protein